jgi:YHS domain-containing protein
MNVRISMAFALALAVCGARAESKTANAAVADPPVPKKQTVCPVQGGPVKSDVFVDYEGKRIYFCCPGCIESFKKDPARYLDKLKQAGVTPEPAPTAKDSKK